MNLKEKIMVDENLTVTPQVASGITAITQWFIIIVVFLVIVIALVFLIRFIRKRIKKAKQLKADIPQDVWDDFKMAEEMLANSNGTKTPQEVLWDVYKIRREATERRFKNGAANNGYSQATNQSYTNGQQQGDRGIDKSIDANAGTKQGTSSSKLYPKLTGRQVISPLPDTGTSEDKRDIDKDKRDTQQLGKSDRKPKRTRIFK